MLPGVVYGTKDTLFRWEKENIYRKSLLFSNKSSHNILGYFA
jgi:hypothetical protein